MHKRVQADDPRAQSAETPEQEELRSRLIGAAMRARQNVARGYSTNRSLTTPHTSPTKPPSNTVFASEADTLHSVFRALPPGAIPPVSPSERGRADREDRDTDDDDDVDMADVDSGDVSKREILPLRKSAQPKIPALRLDGR